MISAVPDEYSHLVPHRHGFEQSEIEKIFGDAGLTSITYQKIPSVDNGDKAVLFIAKGIKSAVWPGRLYLEMNSRRLDCWHLQSNANTIVSCTDSSCFRKWIFRSLLPPLVSDEEYVCKKELFEGIFNVQFYNGWILHLYFWLVTTESQPMAFSKWSSFFISNSLF